jgi:hypothetical protein
MKVLLRSHYSRIALEFLERVLSTRGGLFEKAYTGVDESKDIEVRRIPLLFNI